jgi:Fe-S cluster assembly protein SufD
MRATLDDVTATLLERYGSRREVLPGSLARRDAAAASFRAAGLPSVRDEAWRYTNLRLIGDIIGGISSQAGAVSDFLEQLPAVDDNRVVTVDGQVRDDLMRQSDGLHAYRLADRPEVVLERPAARQFTDLNAMLAEDGAVIEVAAGVDAGVLLLASVATGTVDAFHPRYVIRLGDGARLSVLEVDFGAGSYLHNSALIVTVGRNATFLHARIQNESRAAASIATTEMELAASSLVNSFTLNVGAQLTRAEAHVRIVGEGATAHLNAVQLLSGRQHGDVTTVVRHEAPGCASRQTVKNVLTGHARAVFQGKIEVARAAQKTDAYQMNQSLLLSPDAEADSKPQLEIYADDVKCSHGATVGELDAELLFYLRSRGLPLPEARKLLIEAFISAALDEIDDARLRAPVGAAIGAAWAEWQQ